jgi:hypothetical protein
MMLERWTRARRWIFYREMLDTQEGTSHAVASGVTLCGRPISSAEASMWFRDGNAYSAQDVSCRRCQAKMKEEI